MKKLLKTRYVALFGLVLVVALSVLLSRKLSNEEFGLQAARVAAEDNAMSEAQRYYGQAQYVNAASEEVEAADSKAVGSNEYFAKARLNREKSREKAIEMIKETLDDASLTEKAKTEAMLLVAQTAQRVEQESSIENLIIAKGFEDCMVYLNGDNADVVVKSSGLSENQVVQIKEIVSKGSELKGEIKIIEVK